MILNRLKEGIVIGDGVAIFELDPFVLTRAEIARYAIAAKEIGVNFGICCGAGPHHIRVMAEVRTVPNSKYSPNLKVHPILGTEKFVKEKDQRILSGQRGTKPDN